ncbi:UDP-N-acetyl-D-glucosamine dehydrogenase [Caldalkalibacillus uzonensis]|uniref:UDP-N-acetyl-D-glucosamine dehydrogenase n=1 Tax=Caldalkalibacillus uzonensis TaxID=353224 RepID=A0ABU0CVD8_9BACI|nr:nucleotide sugar dehydrogenase [Caldalkalibacillus uzonensis]MDQ0339002.1 UDP-N-acetyl-D-glucosamine dehydrogenase [Caldalkalibacillus uzonensis]
MNNMYLSDRTTIAVIGLGYVGLPLAMLFAKNGFKVIGFDRDLQKLAYLRQGKSYIDDVSDSEVHDNLNKGTFEVAGQYEKVRQVNACILCLPTPLNEHRAPDLSYVQSAIRDMSAHVSPGQLIVLESSTFPGTTEDVVRPLLEKNGHKVGVDIYLGYSPERINPGNKEYDIADIPKVVSGVTDQCKERVTQLYGQVFTKLVQVSSPTIAEMTKILENAQRFVNISLMNELAICCEQMGIDIWEVIEAAKTKPYGFTPYYPGPGIGGHCIPVDPLYFLWKARQHHQNVKMIETAKDVNDKMPDYIVQRILKLLIKRNNDMRDRHVLLVGMTYKKDVTDVRESVSIPIFEKLLKQNIIVSYHDPLVKHVNVGNQTYTSVALTRGRLKKSDCVVILTDHSFLPYDDIIQFAPLVFDTRNAIKETYAHVMRL